MMKERRNGRMATGILFLLMFQIAIVTKAQDSDQCVANCMKNCVMDVGCDLYCRTISCGGALSAWGSGRVADAGKGAGTSNLSNTGDKRPFKFKNRAFDCPQREFIYEEYQEGLLAARIEFKPYKRVYSIVTNYTNPRWYC